MHGVHGDISIFVINALRNYLDGYRNMSIPSHLHHHLNRDENMSILMSKDKKELIVTCDCGCDNGLHICIDKYHIDGLDSEKDTFAYATCLSGNWYKDQDVTIFAVIKLKLKKIWAILRNRDFCYSEISMSREDFETFKEYINKVTIDEE